MVEAACGLIAGARGANMGDKRQEGTRERLLEVAGQVFAAKGYEAATLREICRQAGANMAAVSYYFRGKERLYEESVRRAAGSLADELPRWPPGTPAVERLRAFVRAVMSMSSAGRSGWHLRLVLREVLQPGETGRGGAHGAIRSLFESLAGVLDGLLPPEVSPTGGRLIAFSILCQCLNHRLAEVALPPCAGTGEAPRYDVCGVVEHIVQFSLSALRLGSDFEERQAVTHRAGEQMSTVCSTFIMTDRSVLSAERGPS